MSDKNDLTAFHEGKDYYINEQGLLVFTQNFLKKRGYCCENGCTHCPYPKQEETK